MADNLTTTTVVATLPAAIKIATREVSYSGDTAHVAPVGLVVVEGANDAKTATDVTSAAPLPVTITSFSANSATLADEGTFTPATSYIAVIGGVYTTDSLAINKAGGMQMNEARQQVVFPYCLTPIAQYRTTTSSTTLALTNFTAASGLKNNITSVVIANTSATDAVVSLQDDANGTVFAVLPAPASGGATYNFAVPLVQPTANKGLFFATTPAVSTIHVTAIGFQRA